MPAYRTPLPGLLAAMLETGINRILALDEGSAQRLERLDDRMLRLDLEGLGITLFFAFSGRRVEVGTGSKFEPDTTVRGSPFALFSMAAPNEAARWGEAGSRVTISGDATLARDLEQLFSRLDPDWEGRLSRLLGDVWGHQVASGLRAGADQFRESAGAAGDMFREYVKDPRGPVARADELAEFNSAVDEAREEVDRLAARLDALEDDSA